MHHKRSSEKMMLQINLSGGVKAFLVQDTADAVAATVKEVASDRRQIVFLGLGYGDNVGKISALVIEGNYTPSELASIKGRIDSGLIRALQQDGFAYLNQVATLTEQVNLMTAEKAYSQIDVDVVDGILKTVFSAIFSDTRTVIGTKTDAVLPLVGRQGSPRIRTAWIEGDWSTYKLLPEFYSDVQSRDFAIGNHTLGVHAYGKTYGVTFTAESLKTYLTTGGNFTYGNYDLSCTVKDISLGFEGKTTTVLLTIDDTMDQKVRYVPATVTWDDDGTVKITPIMTQAVTVDELPETVRKLGGIVRFDEKTITFADVEGDGSVNYLPVSEMGPKFGTMIATTFGTQSTN